jgi:hypothetical protein
MSIDVRQTDGPVEELSRIQNIHILARSSTNVCKSDSFNLAKYIGCTCAYEDGNTKRALVYKGLTLKGYFFVDALDRKTYYLYPAENLSDGQYIVGLQIISVGQRPPQNDPAGSAHRPFTLEPPKNNTVETKAFDLIKKDECFYENGETKIHLEFGYEFALGYAFFAYEKGDETAYVYPKKAMKAGALSGIRRVTTPDAAPTVPKPETPEESITNDIKQKIKDFEKPFDTLRDITEHFADFARSRYYEQVGYNLHVTGGERTYKAHTDKTLWVTTHNDDIIKVYTLIGGH